jgi:N-acyl-phosphatidylethanolamine-hydrolysing phospholipase D
MDEKRFINPHLTDEKRGFRDALRWKMGGYADPKPLPNLPEDFIYPATFKPYDRNKPSAIWVGHSTYLIKTAEKTFLTDPVWSEHCSPIRLPIFRRLSPTPFSLEHLPRVDVVLISHNHYDHLDKKAVRMLHALQPHILWVLPKKLAPWFHRLGITSCVELNWWEKHGNITAVPAQHFSGRTLWDRDKTFWNGYVVGGEKTFYFVGDTGYNPFHFREIGELFPQIDLSLIPIGSYLPRAFMAPVHCNPSDSVQIHLDTGSRFSLGMHWKTFCLSEEPTHRPPFDLHLAMEEKGLKAESFLPGEIGVHVNF